MDEVFKILNVYHVNSLAAVGLLLMYFAFYKLFQQRNRLQARFFLLNSLAYLANLAYLSWIDFADTLPLQDVLFRSIVVRLINTASASLLLMATCVGLGDTLPKWVMAVPVIPITVMSALLYLLVLARPALAPLWRAPSILLNMVGIVGVGAAYHHYFIVSRRVFPRRTKQSIVLSMYGYAALQVAALLEGLIRLPRQEYLHLAGMACKLSHIYGLTRFGETIFAEYHAKRVAYQRARVSQSLAEQLEHEIGTPALELRARLNRPLDVENRAHVDNLVEQITGLVAAFTKFMSDFAGDASAGRKDYCNLNNICDEAIFSLKIALRPSARIRKYYSAGATVDAVPSDLVQVVRNLVKNGIEAATAANKDRIAIVDVSTRVDPESVDTRWVYVIVNDNGAGVHVGRTPRIFEDGFTTKPGRGRGHGLYIAKQLMEKNEGDLQLGPATPDQEESNALPGACFVARLPMKHRAV